MVVRMVEWFLRRLSRVLVRGPHACQVLADLEEAHARDVARGLGTWHALGRRLTNLIGSAWSLWRSGRGERAPREIGIRGALGAGRGAIAATIGRRAALQLGAGALLGMPAAGWLYFLIREDPSATIAAFLVGAVPGITILLALALLACSAPMLRALRFAPTEAMRGAD